MLENEDDDDEYDMDNKGEDGEEKLCASCESEGYLRERKGGYGGGRRTRTRRRRRRFELERRKRRVVELA